MAPQKLFMTGATGYIGGSVLGEIIEKFPQLEITALLRKPTSEFKSRYANVKIVTGTFDDFDVIEQAAHDCDIMVHTGDIDHPGCAKAILSGMKSKKDPSFLIHLSGTGCISDEREQEWKGDYNPHKWNDLTEIKEIYDLPKHARHHEIDQWVMDASNHTLMTCIICPPDIFGQCTSLPGRATFLVPEFVQALLKTKESFYLGKGENMRAVTYIGDVVALFMLLIEQAVQGGGKAQWGREGFYFAVSGEVQWKQAAEAISKHAVEHGWLPKDTKVVSYNQEQVGAFTPDAPERALYLWGSNSRADSARAKMLGWKPSGPDFYDALSEDITVALKQAGA